MRKGLLNVAGETLQLLEIARSKKSLQKRLGGSGISIMSAVFHFFFDVFLWIP